jgi:cysteine desulfurase / selenocysteine lyase
VTFGQEEIGMAIDVERARADTPGCARRVHLNNAGASLMPRQVVEAVEAHFRREAEIGGYEAKDEAGSRIEAVYDSVARLVGSERDEVALLENATRAWEAVFYSLRLRPGDRILTCRAEYGSNFIAYLQAARRHQVEIAVAPDDEHGQLDVAALRDLIDERVKLIGITHVPTSGGLVNPAAAVGSVARAAGVPFLLDACQSVGQMPVDVDAIGCDFLSATGRKFLRGPRGTGFLYVRRSSLDLLEPWVLEVRSADWIDPGAYRVKDGAQRFETWEMNYAAQLGLGAAVDYALEQSPDAIWERVRRLAELLRRELAGLPGVVVHDLGRTKCGIVTFSVRALAAVEVAAALADDRINVSVSLPKDTLLDFNARGLPEIVRASVHYFNTEQEVERAVRLVADLSA